MCSRRRAASSWGHANLTWVTAGFGWVTMVAPILVAAPLYFSGKVSFGGLMMAAGAFTQAQSSLRWFIDNFSVIADWRATLLRVANFRHALITTTHEPQRIREPHRLQRGRAGCDFDRRPGDRLLRQRRHAQGNEGGREDGRARPHSGRAGNRQDAAVSRIGGILALGPGQHHAARAASRYSTCRAARPTCPAEPCAKCSHIP